MIARVNEQFNAEVKPKASWRGLTSACSHDDPGDQHPELWRHNWHMVDALQVHVDRVADDGDEDTAQYGDAVTADLVGPVAEER